MAIKSTKSGGFTLIELSASLVIIAVLVGITLTSRNLMNNAKIQSQIADAVRYQTAAKEFKSIYLGLPGDLINANNITGPNGLVLQNAAGNGNGQISTGTEQQNVFMALSRAGLIGEQFIQGEYPDMRLGENSIVIYYVDEDQDKNYILLGYISDAERNVSSGALLGEEAYHIDEKIDDGHPYSGNSIVFYDSDTDDDWEYFNGLNNHESTECVANENYDASSTSAVYNVSGTTRECGLLINLGL